MIQANGIIVANIVGAIVAVLCVISMQMRTKKGILAFQIVGNILYSLQFLILWEISTALIAIIALLRCVFFYICEKRNIKAPFWGFMLFTSIGVIVTVLTGKNAVDILPLIGMTAATYGYYSHNVNTTRRSMMCANICFTIFCIITSAYTSALNEMFQFISGAVALWRYRSKGLKAQETRE